MIPRVVLAFGALLTVALTMSSCGGSTLGPTSIPLPTATPAATPNFPVIMAAGDISCDSATPQLPCKSKETSDLIHAAIGKYPGLVVLPLGDLQYDSGTLAEFRKNYDATWGRLNEFAHPVPGNHEYETRNATGYFDYFQTTGVAVGARNEGFYTYAVSDWRFFALNSNCDKIGGCNAGSAQYRWLQGQLSLSRERCAVAYMHYPFQSSGTSGNFDILLPLMQLLHANGVDIVLAGHDHDYEEFVPITPELVPDPTRGMRLFVVGTGGRDTQAFPRAAAPHSAFRTRDHFGVLKITMKPTAYDWAFINIEGATIRSGSGACS